MGVTIELAGGTWEFDPARPLGKAGGFGAVFEGVGPDGKPVAVKRLHLTVGQAGHRELQMAEALKQRSLRWVLPVLDAGQDVLSNAYYIVMPRGIESLQDYITRNGPVGLETAISVLQQITSGLAEVPDIVHRDLKPGNILFFDDHWCIADFGIARFVEEATSAQTVKAWLSREYAAPEQWQGIRATAATDIYAVGCIAYAILTGYPPFRGPDYQHQHLAEAPPTLLVSSSRLSMLVSSMLRKAPEARPALARVIDSLQKASLDVQPQPKADGLRMLAEVGAAEAAASARSEASQLALQRKSEYRRLLAEQGTAALRAICDVFASRIADVAPATIRVGKPGQNDLLYVGLGRGSLSVTLFNRGAPFPEGAFPRSKWNVVAGAKIVVTQTGEDGYRWGANLWYMPRQEGSELRWWEVAYMWHPLYGGRKSWEEPFAVDEVELADKAAGPGIDIVQFGSSIRSIDDEDTDDFIDRWSKLLGLASQGQLRKPNYLPLT